MTTSSATSTQGQHRQHNLQPAPSFLLHRQRLHPPGSRRVPPNLLLVPHQQAGSAVLRQCLRQETARAARCDEIRAPDRPPWPRSATSQPEQHSHSAKSDALRKRSRPAARASEPHDSSTELHFDGGFAATDTEVRRNFRDLSFPCILSCGRYSSMTGAWHRGLPVRECDGVH